MHALIIRQKKMEVTLQERPRLQVFISIFHFIHDNARNKKYCYKTGESRESVKQRQNAPKCTILNIHFKNFSGGDTLEPPFSPGGEGQKRGGNRSPHTRKSSIRH